METDHNSIHQWLAKVSDARSACNATGDPNNFGSVPANTLPIAPKLFDTSREHALVKGGSLVQGQIQPQKAGHEVHLSFDRKLRHKTREDRYEYKGASTSKTQSTSNKNKIKRRRSRKHTMDDMFRAPNVARERLTLRGNLNIGIFNKGKVSSPLKLGHIPDSAFSERKFLTKRQPGTPSKSPTTDKKRKADPEASRRGTGRQQKWPEYVFSGFSNEPEIEDDKTKQLVSQVGEFGQPNDEASIDQGLCVGRGSGPIVQRELLDTRSHRSSLTQPVENTAGWSESASLYTWSETNLEKSQPEHALEIELLKLLHVGLFPAQGDDLSRETNQNHTYYDLDELKAILKGRKECWVSENSLTRQVVATLPVTVFRHNSIAEIHKKREGFGSAAPIDSTYPQANDLNPEESSHDKIVQRQISSRPVSQLHKTKVSPIPQPNRLEPGTFSINDTQEAQGSPPDDIFFSNLDAAFWAIVDPNSQNEMDSLVMMGIQRSPIFDSEDIMITAELKNAEVSKRPSQGTLSHAQVGVETLYSPQPAANGYCGSENPVTDLEDGQNRFILSRVSQKEELNCMPIQRYSHLHSSTAHYSNDDPIPPGFWRQNRLC
ncbi:uncharacterized protein N7484_007202 [Penicillium longicatenatum]|uniref:uncharacterized protein n=1 Tax=Penicillium longicatenatum TaxID=1561947 RepID=UPI002548D2D1|nr:uncharacterized protein N7484_007202 [Penicillium longicatenatum]KAJ5639340.1 hypothetical protein N7484_007202 [Penicillium longicatenatum]